MRRWVYIKETAPCNFVCLYYINPSNCWPTAIKVSVMCVLLSLDSITRCCLCQSYKRNKKKIKSLLNSIMQSRLHISSIDGNGVEAYHIRLVSVCLFSDVYIYKKGILFVCFLVSCLTRYNKVKSFQIGWESAPVNLRVAAVHI